MAWLRIDDGFPSHPKFSGWSRAQKWALLELFVYCAKHKTGGVVPSDLDLLPRAVTPALLKLAVDAGFVDVEDGVYVVHDWSHYNPNDVTGAERQARFRHKNRNAVSVTKTVTATVTEALPTRARDPVPSPKEEPNGSSMAKARERNPVWDALVEWFQEPASESERRNYGRILRSLQAAGATRDEVYRRCKAWPQHFPGATLTINALEAHWTELGRKPHRVSA